MDIRTLQSAIARLVAERAGDPLESPKNLAVSLAAEAGTLLSLYRALSERQKLTDPYAREAAGDALASIVLYALQLAGRLDVDTAAVIEARLPADLAGSLGPPPSQDAAVVAEAASVSAPAPEPVKAAAGPAAAEPPAAKTEARKRGGAPEIIAVKVAATPAPRKATAAQVEVIVIEDDDAAVKAVAPVAAAPHPTAAPVPAPATTAPAKTATTAPAKTATTAPATTAAAATAELPAAAPGSPNPPVAAPPQAPPSAADALDSELADLDEAPSTPFVPSVAPLVPEPYQRLDTQAVLDLAKALTREVDRNTRDDPTLRDLRDELETLVRTLYAANAKKAWIAGSLKSVRGCLEASLSHGFAEDIRAAVFLARIDVLLED
jgi:NTP pyrophosphatase (non-canonical NTP hydrolase)